MSLFTKIFYSIFHTVKYVLCPLVLFKRQFPVNTLGTAQDISHGQVVHPSASVLVPWLGSKS